jgi:hypothetical protein
MSVEYKKAEAIARAYDDQLTADNSRFNNAVQIIHEEGTVLFYRSAFLMTWKEWIFVFAEHHGYSIHHKEDLSGWLEFTPTYEAEEIDEACLSGV